MFSHITTAQDYITPENATTEIPRLINASLQERRPVHIHLPIDVAMTEIEVTEPFKLQNPKQHDVSEYIKLIQQNYNPLQTLSLLQAMKSIVSIFMMRLNNS